MELLKPFSLTSPEALLYWITERWNILQKKQDELSKPWSDDPVFQKTYFCNVRREDDKVTKWIRKTYSPYVNDPMFEYNIILARFLNWPDTLGAIGYIKEHNPDMLLIRLDDLAEMGKLWGNAYVVTTHGIRMEKAAYLCGNVLEGAYRSSTAILNATRHVAQGGKTRQLEGAHNALMQLEGLGSFMAAQVIADLKNTTGHPLALADDWWTWSALGPGSLRGMSWFFYNEPGKITKGQFNFGMIKIREYVDSYLPDRIPKFCNQDLQNCLCEYDKYMRVRNGTGRSKRGYSGI